jgi:tetratricopeptide (TPR) repeat protein
MHRAIIACCLLLAQYLATSASAGVTLFSGEMELVTVSGNGCSEKDKPGNRLPLDLTLEQGSSSSGQEFTGYFSGPDMQVGRFSGADLSRLQVIYPDAPGHFQGHTLVLETKPGFLTGELRELPQSNAEECYFEKAVLKLKQEPAGNKADLLHLRQSSLFDADASYLRGQSLLKTDKPGEAIVDLTRSLNLRSGINPNDPDRALPAVALAIAGIMEGRETKAMAVLRDLFGKRSEAGDAIVKQRTTAIVSLCNDEQFLTENYAGHKAALQLMEMLTREFGGFDGVAVPLSGCYFEMAKEQKDQDDPNLAIEYFQKAIDLVPDNPDSITGIAMTFVDKDAPAEGRRYLNEHKENFIKKAGKVPYDTLLSYLYAAEAQDAGDNGDLARAAELLREAIKASPGDRTLLVDLTRVLGKDGKVAEARQLLESGRNACHDATCRQEFADELARQDLIARMVKRLETSSRVP